LFLAAKLAKEMRERLERDSDDEDDGHQMVPEANGATLVTC